MTAVSATIVGVLLCAWTVMSTHHSQNATSDDGGNGAELSLKQTIMSADKIVKSLATDDKIARAVHQPGTRKSSDKRMSFEQNIAAQEADEEDEEEEDEDEEENAEGVEGTIGKEGKERREDKPNKGPKIWDQWSKWSACSVTCGIGKITRWRHCVSGGCAPGEKEAQIKTCTLPSC